MSNVVEIPVPENMGEDYLPNTDFADNFSILVTDKDMTLEQAARNIFEHTPKWIVKLLALRNLLVRPFGLRGTVPTGEKEGDVIGFFPVIKRGTDDIVLGFDDKHLDFRIIVCLANEPFKTISVATLVRRNNLLGKIYLFFVKPFHRIIVPTMLKQVNR